MGMVRVADGNKSWDDEIEAARVGGNFPPNDKNFAIYALRGHFSRLSQANWTRLFLIALSMAYAPVPKGESLLGSMMAEIPYVAPAPFSLNRGGAADQIIADIRDQILLGKLPRGAKLPSERELAQTYQVSGPTIREAIRGLASLSLVESRHGTGVYVTAAVDLMFAVATSTLIELEKVNMLEVLDTLEALYVKAAALACVHAPDEELAALALSLDALDQEKSPEDLSEGLRIFLGLMADAAHNILISTFCKFLIGLLLESAKEQRGGLGSSKTQIADKLRSDRRDLVLALQARDVTRATSLAAAYHRNTRRLVEELLQGGTSKGDATMSRASKRMRQVRK